VFTCRAILSNFTPIQFETTEPQVFRRASPLHQQQQQDEWRYRISSWSKMHCCPVILSYADDQSNNIYWDAGRWARCPEMTDIEITCVDYSSCWGSINVVMVTLLLSDYMNAVQYTYRLQKTLHSLQRRANQREETFESNTRQNQLDESVCSYTVRSYQFKLKTD